MRVCKVAGAPSPENVRYYRYTAATTASSTASGQRRQAPRRQRNQPPLFQKAPGYRRLRTIPRGMTLRVLAGIVTLVVTVGLGGFAGLVPALLLPEWIGAVRVLIAIIGVALGICGGIWLFAALTHVVTDGLRWMVASYGAMTPAPPGRFFHRRGTSEKWSGLVTAGMILLVPALIGWGPGVALASGAHGVSDSHLVAGLRADGARTQGFLVDVPVYSTDDNGNTTETDVPTLAFTAQGQSWSDTDPSIGGQPLPLDSGDPLATHEPVTVVYDPSDPGTAAALRQITGSVWHGAPTANVIVGTILTLVLPYQVWRVILRIRRRKWLRNAGMVDDLVGAA
jgi:hypothetical protein